MSVQTTAQGFITSLPPAPIGEIGSFYLYEEFNKADIILLDSTKIIDVVVRVDLRSNMIEIQYNKTIRVVLLVSKMLGITLKKGTGAEQYINGTLLSTNTGINKDRLLQVIYKDTISLLCKIETAVIRGIANPNPMLNEVRRDDEIVLKKSYIITKGVDVVDASESRSKFREDMTSVFGSDVAPLLKKTNPKSVEDLLTLVKELNKRNNP